LHGAAIAACPTKHLTYLHTQFGKPRSAKALGGDFRKWCDAAGLPKRCPIHGLRKGALRRGADAGLTTHELQALGGHKSLSALQPYTEAFNRKLLAVQAMAKLRKRRSDSA
jgi:integrase